MIEIKGELFDWIDKGIICITTNSVVKNNGCAVMGGGCAAEAKNRWPGCDRQLGNWITIEGNRVGQFSDDGKMMFISFPTKYHWKDPSDIELIRKSCNELKGLMDMFPEMKDKPVVIPRPGCGCGRLKWDDVRVVMQEILTDDRYMIISREGED